MGGCLYYLKFFSLGGVEMTSEYLITVITGTRKGAGTDASVSLVIKGNAKYRENSKLLTSYLLREI